MADMHNLITDLLNENVPLVYAFGTQIPENEYLRLFSSFLRDASGQIELEKCSFENLSKLLSKLGEFIKSGIIANRNLTAADNSVNNGTFFNALHATVASLEILAKDDLSDDLYKRNTIDSIFHFYKRELKFSSAIDKRELISMTSLINKIINSRNLTESSIKIISANFLNIYFKNTVPLQKECIHLFKSIIKKYASERITFFEEFKVCLPILGMSCYRKDDILHIHTKLFLYLIEAFALVNKTNENLTFSTKSVTYRQTFKTIWTNIAIFLEEFINICDGNISSNSLSRELFKCFITDLVSIADDPKWPAAGLILINLLRVLLMLLKRSNSALLKRKFIIDCLQILVPVFGYFSTSVDVFDIYKTISKIFPNYSQKVDWLDYKNPIHVRLLLQKFLLDYNEMELHVEQNSLYLTVWTEEYYQKCTKNARQKIKFLLEELGQSGNYFCVEINLDEIDVRKLVFKTVFFIEDQDVFSHFVELIELAPKLAPTLRPQIFEFLKDVCLANPKYLLNKKIQTYITHLLYQKTKDYQSTRDVLVSMFSDLVKKNTKIRDLYLRDLYDTIFDVSVTVNKKAVSMFAQLSDCEDVSAAAFLPVILLRRFDGIDNTLTTTLVNIFQAKYFNTPDKVGIIKLTDLVNTCVEFELNRFEHIIKLIIKGEGERKSFNSCNTIQSIIRIITDRIKELIDSNPDDNRLAITKFLSVLELLSRCAPKLLTDNIAKLLVVLQQINVPPEHVIKFTKISQNLLLESKIHDTKFLYTLEDRLLKLLKCVAGVTQDITSLLHHLVKYTKNYSSIKKYCRTSYQFIIGPSNLQDSSFDLHLDIVAAYITHFSLDDLNMKTITAETFQEKVVDVFMGLIPQREAALDGLAAISTRHKNIILQPNVLKLFQNILKDKTNPNSVLIILKCILNILRIEQSSQQKLRIDIIEKSISAQNGLKGLGDGSEEYSATIKIVTSFLDDCLSAYLTLNVEIRMTTIKIIHFIVSLGLYSCDELVPHLLALLTDRQDAISFEALEILIRIHNRFPKILANKAMSGLRQSFLFERILDNNTARFIRGTCICQNTLRVKARTNYIFDNLKSTHRRTFIANIIDAIGNTNTEQYRKYIFYLAENVINFDYTIKEDVFVLIKQIDVTLEEHQYSIYNLNERILKSYKRSIAEDDFESIPCELFSELHKDLLWIYGAFLLQTIKLKIQMKYNISKKAVEKYYKDVREEKTIKTEDALIMKFVTLDETSILKRLGYLDYLNNVNNIIKKHVIEHINEILKFYDNDVDINSDLGSESDVEDKDDIVSPKRKTIMHQIGTCI